MTRRDDRQRHLSELMIVLEQTMAARQELLDRLSRVAARGLDGPERKEWVSLSHRLTDLTREQEELLERLRNVLPPAESGGRHGTPAG